MNFTSLTNHIVMISQPNYILSCLKKSKSYWLKVPYLLMLYISSVRFVSICGLVRVTRYGSKWTIFTFRLKVANNVIMLILFLDHPSQKHFKGNVTRTLSYVTKFFLWRQRKPPIILYEQIVTNINFFYKKIGSSFRGSWSIFRMLHNMYFMKK